MVMNYLHTFYFDANKEAKDCFTMLVNGERVSRIPKVHEQETARGIRVVLTNFKYDEMINVFAYFKIGNGDDVIRISPFRRIKNTFEFYYPAMDEGDYECEIVVTMNNNIVSSGVFQGHCDRSIRGEYYHGVVVGDTVEGIVNAYSTAKALYETGVENMNKLTTEGQEIVDQNKKIVEVEKARVEAEDTRKANEEERQSKETERQELLANIKSSYDEITSDEEIRKQNEEQRESNETLRRESEDTRVGSENTRVENENIRIQNEEERKFNELNRQEQYKKFNKKVDELTTISSKIVTDMEEFSTDEETRKRNENSRQDSIRTIKEDFSNIKALSEDAYNKEIERQNKEKARISNEEERIANEEARKLIDKEREKTKDDIEKLSKEIKSLNSETSSSISKINHLEESVLGNIETSNSVIQNLKSEFNAIKEKNDALEKAENSRIEAESNRTTKETGREESENTRISNESQRVQSENERKEQEEVRVQNEKERVSKEQERKQLLENINSVFSQIESSEETRASKEDERKSNEELRKTSEQQRIDEETKRVRAETERVNVEILRLSSENQRIANEEERISNENIRKSNEDTRIQNEEERKINYKNALAAVKEINEHKIELENILREINDTEVSRVEEEKRRKEKFSTITKASETIKQDEESRKQNELIRQQQEQARVDSENVRHSSEEIRKQNELRRSELESTLSQLKTDTTLANEATKQRLEELNTLKTTLNDDEKKRKELLENLNTSYNQIKSTENTRVEQEEVRVQNETERKSSESARNNKEQERQRAEDERISNETQRIEAEKLRQSNELQRVQAEKNREANAEIIKGWVSNPRQFDGKSAYEVWKATGKEGSVEEYLASLKGEKGKDGVDAKMPNIREGFWYIGDENTGISVKAIDMDPIYLAINNKIKEVIGTAPDTLDTFGELAKALNNDPNFSESIKALINEKADKGYIPEHIPATNITEDEVHKFISTEDKKKINASLNNITVTGDDANYILNLRQSDGNINTVNIAKKLSKSDENRILKVEQDILTKANATDLNKVVTGVTKGDNYSLKINKKDGTNDTITLDKPITSYNDLTDKPDLSKLKSVVTDNTVINNASISGQTITLNRVNGGVVNVEIPKYDDTSVKTSIEELERKNTEKDSLISSNKESLKNTVTDISISDKMITVTRAIGNKSISLPTYNYSDIVGTPSLDEFYKSATITEDNKLKLTKSNDTFDELILPKGFSGNYSDLSGIPSDIVTNSTLESKIQGLNLNQYQLSSNMSNYVLNSKLTETLNNYQPKGEYALASDLTKYATTEILTSKLGEKVDKTVLTSYATKEDIRTKVDTSVLSGYQLKGEYALKSELDDKVTQTSLKSILNNYTNIDDLNNKLGLKADKTQLDGYQVKGDYATNTSLTEKLNFKADKSELLSYATKEELSAKVDSQALNNYALKSELTDKVTQSELNITLEGYTNTQDLNNKLNEKLNKTEILSYATKEELAKLEKQALNEYVLVEEFDEFKTEYQENYYEILTNFIRANQFVSDISFEDGKLAIQTFPTLSTGHTGQPKRIELDLPRYRYSDLIDIPKDLVNSSALEENLKLKADKSELNKYQLKGNFLNLDNIDENGINNDVKKICVGAYQGKKMSMTELFDGFILVSTVSSNNLGHIYELQDKYFRLVSNLESYALKSELDNIGLKNVKDNSNLSIWVGSQEEYDKIESKDNSVLYIIKEGQ